MQDSEDQSSDVERVLVWLVLESLTALAFQVDPRTVVPEKQSQVVKTMTFDGFDCCLPQGQLSGCE
jgi:hypothetical protein